MDDLVIVGTKRSPSVNFNVETGIFNITGNSIMEDPFLFYHTLNEYVEMYINLFPKSTKIDIHIEYMNTSSYRCIINLLKHFVAIPSNYILTVNWMYELDDELMLNDGQECKNITGIEDFNFIPLEITG